ncbi:MAG: 7-carboxy-7-deazaguanine synthase QueE [Cytophagaceae bacterium]|nr:7-carboxy-7-deazaguanine synthase QueE [Cytophagaceae bacterium]
MEDFYTIQGEGFHQGKASYFIRLGGCSVGCHWCDVKESWDASKFPLVSVEDIAKRTESFPAKIMVVTGGEPLEFNLAPLTTALKNKGLNTHLETSGAYPLTGNWDWICFSPKKFKEPLPEIFSVAHELKVIIYNKSDFEWAESFTSKVDKKCKFFLQPEWSKQNQMLPVIIDYIKNNPQWEISLQIHKYMNIP